MTGSLASVHPELIPEWSEKNLPLTPDKIRWYIMTIEPTVVSVAAILISIPRKRRLANAKSRCWISSKKHSLWKKKDRSFLIFIAKLL